MFGMRCFGVTVSEGCGWAGCCCCLGTDSKEVSPTTRLPLSSLANLDVVPGPYPSTSPFIATTLAERCHWQQIQLLQSQCSGAKTKNRSDRPNKPAQPASIQIAPKMSSPRDPQQMRIQHNRWLRQRAKHGAIAQRPLPSPTTTNYPSLSWGCERRASGVGRIVSQWRPAPAYMPQFTSVSCRNTDPVVECPGQPFRTRRRS